MDNWIIFIVRLSICMILSLLIGYEREGKDSFGLKIYMLVGIGTYLFVSVATSGIEGVGARIAAQIVSGISFLGTGAIIINNNELRGLNVAATMWCITAIGMLTGFGLVFEAVLGTMCVLSINIFINNKKNRFMYDKDRNVKYYIKIYYKRDISIYSKLDRIKECICYLDDKKKIFSKYNICYLIVNNISYEMLNIFVSSMREDKNIKIIYFD